MMSAKRFLSSRRGESASSYALTVGLVAVVALLAITAVGTGVRTMLGKTGNTLSTAVNASGDGGTGGGGGGGGGGGPDPCAGTPTRGTLCADGSFYVATRNYGSGNVNLYVTACDLGRSFSGGTCSGTYDLMAWNDGSQNFTNTSLTDQGNDGAASADFAGQANTTTLVAADASTAGGQQSHEAATGCDNLTVHGRSDWYLPAAGELDLVWTATHLSASTSNDGPQGWFSGGQASGTPLAQTFTNLIFANNSNCGTSSGVDQFGYPCRLWSSSESQLDYGWDRAFSEGYRSQDNKGVRKAIRCVRHD